ncbi:class F sortase [Streptomyces sp. NPDC050416]|uniref:class F sortase n=1 Tax=Streptomyces sp. NPDC050416 TaxID=3365611 RepID=UPI0037B77A32
MTVCGLSAAVAGWLISSAPQPSPADVGSVPVSGDRSATGGRTTASPPTHIRGPKNLDVAVVPVASLADGALALPEDLGTGGWWALGAAVGSSQGTVLIAGHVDTHEDGLGPFAALHELPLGARIEVTAADGQVHAYQVNARRTYRQEQLPGDLFAGDGVHRLVLVTCAGPYDRTAGRYQRNLVLYATPVAMKGRAADRPGPFRTFLIWMPSSSLQWSR